MHIKGDGEKVTDNVSESTWYYTFHIGGLDGHLTVWYCISLWLDVGLHSQE